MCIELQRNKVDDTLSPPTAPQCGRFHDVSLFDSKMRTCRERLDRHAARRRRAYVSRSQRGRARQLKEMRESQGYHRNDDEEWYDDGNGVVDPEDHMEDNPSPNETDPDYDQGGYGSLPPPAALPREVPATFRPQPIRAASLAPPPPAAASALAAQGHAAVNQSTHSKLSMLLAALESGAKGVGAPEDKQEETSSRSGGSSLDNIMTSVLPPGPNGAAYGPPLNASPAALEPLPAADTVLRHPLSEAGLEAMAQALAVAAEAKSAPMMQPVPPQHPTQQVARGHESPDELEATVNGGLVQGLGGLAQARYAADVSSGFGQFARPQPPPGAMPFHAQPPPVAFSAAHMQQLHHLHQQQVLLQQQHQEQQLQRLLAAGNAIRDGDSASLFSCLEQLLRTASTPNMPEGVRISLLGLALNVLDGLRAQTLKA